MVSVCVVFSVGDIQTRRAFPVSVNVQISTLRATDMVYKDTNDLD